MSGYFDPVSEAEKVLRESIRQRDRVEMALNGWWRERSSPRMTMLLFLAGSGLPAFAAGKWGHQHGVATPLCVLYGVLLMWAIFMLLVCLRAREEMRRLEIDAGNLQHFVTVEQLATLNAVLRANDPVRAERREIWGRRLQHARGNHNGMPGGDILLLMVVGSASLGIYIIWQLMCAGPGLLTQTLLDEFLAPREPKLAARIQTQPWFPNFVGATGIHFLGLAVATFFFVFSLPYLLLFFSQAHAHHP